MTTLQEKRHRETTTSIARTVAQRDALLDRLVRAEVKLKALRKLEARQAKALTKPKPAPYRPGASLASRIDDALTGTPSEPKTAPAATAATPDLIQQVTAAIGYPPVNADDGIPTFLDRRKQAEAKDAEARARIAADSAERKKAKTKVRIEKMKVRQEKKMAKLTGETRRMPLTGRAALAHIRATGARSTGTP